MYTVDYFIQKFEAIPEIKWCTGSTNDNNGAHCALGHLSTGDYMINSGNNVFVWSLEKLLHDAGIQSHTQYGSRNGWNIADINNGDHPRYQQPTPKARILAALYDIKKMQQPEEKVKTVYVSVPTTITEQVSDLILS